MPKLKATWSIDLKAMEHTDRGYHMDIEPGGLYEIWLPFDEHPKPWRDGFYCLFEDSAYE